jgi:hypothetical protein
MTLRSGEAVPVQAAAASREFAQGRSTHAILGTGARSMTAS